MAVADQRLECVLHHRHILPRTLHSNSAPCAGARRQARNNSRRVTNSCSASLPRALWHLADVACPKESHPHHSCCDDAFNLTPTPLPRYPPSLSPAPPHTPPHLPLSPPPSLLSLSLSLASRPSQRIIKSVNRVPSSYLLRIPPARACSVAIG